MIKFRLGQANFISRKLQALKDHISYHYVTVVVSAIQQQIMADITDV